MRFHPDSQTAAGGEGAAGAIPGAEMGFVPLLEWGWFLRRGFGSHGSSSGARMCRWSRAIGLGLSPVPLGQQLPDLPVAG